MIDARGMTLIEVLAATVLLAIVVSACLPWMTSESLDSSATADVSLQELGRIADQILATPEEHGLTLDAGSGSRHRITFVQDASDLAYEIVVSVLLSDDSELDHGWVSFAVGDQIVWRWIKNRSKLEAGL